MGNVCTEADDNADTTSTQSKSKKTLYFCVGSTLAFILYTILVLTPTGSCFRLDGSSNSLGLTFSYTSVMVQNFFELRSQDQLDCYKEFLQIWDVVFAVIYTLMYCSWIMYLYENKRIFLLVPILAMIADWSENFAEILMINSYLESEPVSGTLVSVGSGINSLKFILMSLTYLIIMVGIRTKLKLFIRKNKQSESIESTIAND